MRAALVVLDGWGIGDHDRLDAVRAADTPTMGRLADQGATGTLDTSGRSVGLPDGQMGNSEVGHLTIGAGRVIDQSYTRITRAIEAGELPTNDAIASAFDQHVGAAVRTADIRGYDSSLEASLDDSNVDVGVEFQRRTTHRGDDVAVVEFVVGYLPRDASRQVDIQFTHHVDDFRVDLVGRHRPAGENLDTGFEASASPFSLRERGRHLTSAGVLHAHESEPYRSIAHTLIRPRTHR